jgi:ABC-type lipoprotein release transport system permease subunit
MGATPEVVRNIFFGEGLLIVRGGVMVGPRVGLGCVRRTATVRLVPL